MTVRAGTERANSTNGGRIAAGGRYRAGVHRPVEDPPTFATRHAASLRALLAPYGLFGRAEQFVVVAILQVVGSYALSGLQPTRSAPDALGVVLLVAGAAFLLVGEPLLVRAVGTVVVAAGYLAAGYTAGPVLLAPALGLVSAVLVGPVLPLVAVTVGGVALLVLGSWIGPDPVSFGTVLTYLGWATAVLAFATAMRLHGEREEARARVLEEFRGRRAAEERLRIARNLHDALSQQISLMSTKARLARHVLTTTGWRRPDEVGQALEAISRSGVDLLAELRSVSGALDADGATAASHPAPGLSGLMNLIRANAESGLEVQVVGRVGRLYRVIDQTAYLVVKAALDDVSQNSSAVRALVRLEIIEIVGSPRLVVTVVDEVTHPDEETKRATGLAEIRDRVATLGGNLTAGPVDGTWQVRAVLPLQVAVRTVG